MEQPSVVFGQPLQKLLPQNQVKNHSGSSTPVLSLKDQRLMSLCPADPQVPDIVRKAIHYLDRKGVMVEGIFRIPGEKTRIDKVIVWCGYGIVLLCLECQDISVT